MKLFKYFTYSEMKEICNKLEDKNCYYRHPQLAFIRHLSKETVDKLVDIKFLKDSPSTGNHWDYNEDCYEFTKKFKNIFSFISLPFFVWFKIYILKFYRFKHIWQTIRIKCGYHYVWT